MDDILNSLFSDGRLNIEKANSDAEAAQKALEEMEEINKKFNSSIDNRLKKLTDDVKEDTGIGKLAEDAQKEIDALNKSLKRDGLIDEAEFDLKFSDEVANAFEISEDSVNQKLIGQEALISSVALAFKRPYVTGGDTDMPRSRTLLIGKNGTGKHAALENFTAELQKNGVLRNGGVTYIDLAKYSDNTSEKIFVQDFYSAVTASTQVIAFENFERCHTSVLSLVSSLFTKGSVPLSGRYSVQKGGLAEIGNALVPNVISEISAKDKYLFIITEKDEKKIVDVFGMPFLSACADICKSNDFTDENLTLIADKLLSSFCNDVENRFGISMSYDKLTIETLVSKFSPSGGINSMADYLQALIKAVGEFRLSNPSVSGKGNILSGEGELTVKLDAAEHIITGSNKAGSAEDAIAEVKKELNEVIGLKTVKEYILSLEDNFKIQQLRQQKGMKSESPSMHMIFTGNPGTGKTTVARIVSRYLKAIGVLSGGQLIEVTRADLVGKYVGHTAPLTQKAIESALGGVLFIDEAYSLFRGNDDSFGLEAIDTLVKGMEDNRDNLVVILAGYSNEMAEFLTANSGLKSRFPNIIEFPDYTAQELVDITKSIVKSKGYTIEDDCDEPLFVHYDIEQKTGDPRTNGNGRMARNKTEEAIINCSKRNLALNSADMNLELLTLSDFNLRKKEEEKA